MLKKKTTPTELGILISEKREKIGISQRELARQANMDCAEVSRIESGKRIKPNILYLKGIAETLNLSLVKLMTLAGYNDIEINWGKDISDKRSRRDYQDVMKQHQKAFVDIAENMEQRRMNAFACKGVIADLIDKIELAKIENKEIPNDVILEDLKELLTMIQPNLQKFDKSMYIKYDRAVLDNK